MWQWVTGEEWNYTNWNSGEPNNSGGMGEENCLTMVCDGSHTTGVWIDQTHLYEIPYICEWDEDLRGGISDGYILNLDNELALSIESGALQLTSTSWGIEETSQTTLTADTWQHVLLRLSGGTAKVYLDGTEALSASITGNVIEPETVRLGGYYGFMDEFVFRNEAGTDAPTIPTHPYNGTLDIAKVGGYGTGLDGDAEIRIISQINSYGLINSITDSKTFTVSSWSNGDLLPSDGCEIMLHITAPKSETSAEYPLVGLYAFSKIASVIGTSIILEDEITTGNGYDFTLSSSLLSTYYVQVITVPNYKNLTINSGITVNPLTWSTTTGGGIVAFRCTGDCEVNGSILTHGCGVIRYDLQQITNSKLIDRFLCSQGGGIFITCGGTFTTSNTARIGASYSGLGEDNNGAAGYGGNGGNSQDASGGLSGVGGGGGGAAQNYAVIEPGGNCGENGYDGEYGSGGGGCGGNGGNGSCGGGGGGGQGGSGGAAKARTGSDGNPPQAGTINGGHRGDRADGAYHSGAGGGGAGGNGGYGCWYISGTNRGTLSGGVAGASIILIAKILTVDAISLSTGGAAGTSYISNNPNCRMGSGGGGGTGFCYIACEEQVN